MDAVQEGVLDVRAHERGEVLGSIGVMHVDSWHPLVFRPSMGPLREDKVPIWDLKVDRLHRVVVDCLRHGKHEAPSLESLAGGQHPELFVHGLHIRALLKRGGHLMEELQDIVRKECQVLLRLPGARAW